MVVKTTKELLADSFCELAGQRAISRITIKDITDNCGMAPATFYRHFQNKYDLIAWDYENRMREIMERACSEETDWPALQVEYLAYYQQNKQFFLNVFHHAAGYDSFVKSILDISVRQIKYYLQKVKGVMEQDAELDLYIRIYCRSAAVIVSQWLLGAMKESGEQVAAVLDNSFPYPVRNRILG